MIYYNCQVALLAKSSDALYPAIEEAFKEHVLAIHRYYGLKSESVGNELERRWPLWIILDATSVMAMKPILSELSIEFPTAKTIVIGGLHDVKALVRCGEFGIDILLHKISGVNRIIQTIRNTLPILSTERDPIETRKPPTTDRVDQRQPATHFISNRSRAMQKNICTIQENRMATTWWIKGADDAESLLLAREITINIGHPSGEYIVGLSEGCEDEKNMVHVIFPPFPAIDQLESGSSYIFISCQTGESIDFTENFNGVILEVPPLSQRIADKMEYIHRWLPTIKRMNLQESELNVIALEQVKELLIDHTISNFTQLWERLERLVLHGFDSQEVSTLSQIQSLKIEQLEKIKGQYNEQLERIMETSDIKLLNDLNLLV